LPAVFFGFVHGQVQYELHQLGVGYIFSSFPAEFASWPEPAKAELMVNKFFSVTPLFFGERRGPFSGFHRCSIAGGSKNMSEIT